MSKGERDELLRLVRSRERVLKAEASRRGAQMLEEFESKISRQFKYDETQTWEAANDKLQAALKDYVKVVDDYLEAQGIPAEFGPRISLLWHGRGPTAVNERRNELRRVAKAQIELAEASARVEIEKMSLQAQTEIVASGLESEGAKAFLERMPPIERLMPSLDPKAIEDNLKDHPRRVIN